MTKTEQRDAALKLGNAKRMAVADLRRRLLSGETDIRDLLLDPPGCVSHLSVVDVIALQFTRPNEGAWRWGIGRKAVKAGVNLLVPIGRASEKTLCWAALNAPPPRRRRRSSR